MPTRRVGRPSNTTDVGNRAPITELGSAYLGYGSSGFSDGRLAPWSQFYEEVETVPELMWPHSVRTYNEMRRDSQLAALVTATLAGVTQLRYILDPNGARDSLVKEISEDLNLPIKGKDEEPKARMKNRFVHAKFVGQALLAVIYGYAYHEQMGEIVDGKWRLRKLAARPQNTISNIFVAEDGGLVSIRQWTRGNPPDITSYPEIPVDRLVAFIFQQENYSWVGRSMLHDCFRDWVLKDKLLRIDVINHERAGGVPYANAPMGATVDEIEDLDQMMRRFRVGDTAGAALPFGADLNIAKGTGSQVVESIRARDEAMARRFLLMLANLAQGGQHVGSYALSENFEDFFLLGQRAIANWYCETMNEHLIEDIADWNYGENEEFVPRLTWERTTEDSLGVEQLALLVQRGILLVDDELENAVRYKYQLPKRTDPRPPDVVVGPGIPRQPPETGSGAGGPGGGAAPSKAKPPATPSTKAKPPANVAKAIFDWAAEQIEEPDVMAMAKQTEPVLVTVPNVPILEAGVQYMLSSGPATFTPEDLRDAVTAANEDPAIPKPRHKIGHVDPRYNGPSFDGAPAFGKYTNLRLSDNGMIVYADAVGVPKWLADIMPTAYPSRSVEGNWNVQTQSGHTWSFVITAVSALGVYWPGVTQLEDLPMYYGADRPADVVVDEDLVAASRPGGGSMTVLAAANLDDIRRSFYSTYVPEHQGDGAAMWWVRAVYTDPNELLVEDDNDGQLYLLPFTSDAKGTVEFGKAAPVRISYVRTKKAAAAVMAALAADDRVAVASWPSRAESRPDTTAGGAMDPKEIRSRLNLPEDASDEQVQAAIKELNQAAGMPVPGEQAPAGQPDANRQQGGTTGVGTGLADTPTEEQKRQAHEESIGSGASEEEKKAHEERLATAAAAMKSLPDGFTVVDRETLELLKTGAQAGLDLQKKTEQQRREDLVTAAIGDGKIPPSRKKAHLDALALDFEGHSAVLASLPAGLIPVNRELGTGNGGGDTDALAKDAEVVSSWTRTLFPEVKRADEAMASGGYPQIMSEDGFAVGGTGVLGR